MRWHQLVIFAGLTFLVIIGLNISNQGINSLTGEERQAVFNLNCQQGGIRVEIMGNSYDCSWDKLGANLKSAGEKTRTFFYDITDYLKRIWTIFDAVFLYE